MLWQPFGNQNFMTIKVKLDALNGKRLGRERRVVFRRKPQANVSPNEFASKIANEIYDEISEPFLEIYNFLESKNLLTDEITEKIFDERDKLFWKLEGKEFFERTFRFKNVGREIGKLNSETPKFSKSDFFNKLNQFIKSYYGEHHESPTQPIAAKHLKFANGKSLKRKMQSLGEWRDFRIYCRDTLNL